jgi:hypothetical protein
MSDNLGCFQDSQGMSRRLRLSDGNNLASHKRQTIAG